eukprot:COSAG01_NODE_60915_length_292_cov_0.792746_1_plen_95_part_10
MVPVVPRSTVTEITLPFVLLPASLPAHAVCDRQCQPEAEACTGISVTGSVLITKYLIAPPPRLTIAARAGLARRLVEAFADYDVSDDQRFQSAGH